MTRTRNRFAIVVAVGAMLTIAAPAALAANRTKESGGCTRNAPRASIDNTWAWAAPGSWGLPGQKVMYAIDVFNNDVGCASSSFVVSMSAPSGFAVSIPASTITLKSASTGYVWGYVTSPTSIADGDNVLTATVTRTGVSSDPSTSYYKVYSSDAVAPTLFWENPWDGATISGRSYSVGVASSDDHAVNHIDIYIDSVYTSTSVCDGISPACMISYTWAIRRVHGQHTVTFKSTDWMGNVSVLNATVTVN